jgi:ferric-dicitrate binding protein FerR (iron transport regulator)
MSVRVLGTKFNFKTSQVSLVEGSVEVRGLHDEGMLVLQPGQRAEIDPATQRLKVSEVDAALEAVWHDDYIPFHNASIAAIAQTLEAVYGMEVVVSDDFDPATTYSGYIRRKESIDSVLTALKNTIPMDYQIRGKAIYIKEI